MSGVNSKFHPVPQASTSQNGALLAVASTSQLLPCIFEMNVDCFEELFEFLSLKDLKTLRKTCKRMKQVVDYFIRMNFPRALQKIRISEWKMKPMEDFRCTEIKGFELVNHIRLWNINFTPALIEGIQLIFGQAETVEVSGCTFDTLDFYDDFLKYCTRLKSLYVEENDIQYRGKWLHQRYPTLEHIAVDYTDLEILFKNNPNIQHFSVFEFDLWNNRSSIRKSSIKIERLDIIWNNETDTFGDFLIDLREQEFFQLNIHRDIEKGQFFTLLDELHEQGFFQRLYFRFYKEADEENFRRIISLRGLEGLFGYQPKKGILPELTNLKELGVVHFDDVGASEVLTMASNLPNLQRIAIKSAKFVHILPFIHQCPKLTQIKIDNLQTGDIFLIKNDIINLPEINKEREKLSKARKVTIFVDENIFLANKWKQNINLNLIELKRIDSWGKSNPFSLYF